MGDTTHIWVGFNQAGVARAWCWDDPGYERDTQATLAEWRNMGRTVERMPKSDALKLLNTL